MTTYKTAKSELDGIKKARVMAAISYYTNMEGGIDFDKVNPESLKTKFGITVEDAKTFVSVLMTEGKVEVAAEAGK